MYLQDNEEDTSITPKRHRAPPPSPQSPDESCLAADANSAGAGQQRGTSGPGRTVLTAVELSADHKPEDPKE